MSESASEAQDPKSALETLLAIYVDGPERLVAEAIAQGVTATRNAALDGGLVNNKLRQVAWPMLLSESRTGDGDNSVCKRSEKEDVETFKQIQLDVPRSVPKERVPEFENFLKNYFTEHSDLCFYQGFADVAWAVFRVMMHENVTEEGLAATNMVLSKLSRYTILRDAHRQNFDTIFSYLPCITAVISQSDNELGKIWLNSDIAQNHWAIGPLVSFFAHGSTDERVLGQILDAVIAFKDYVDFPLYIISAVPLLPQVREQLVTNNVAEPSAVHEIVLGSISKIEEGAELIALAMKLHQRFPSRMMLKTARAAGAPEDSQLVVGVQRANSSSMLRKRSWRTFNFFSDFTENKLPIF